VGEPEDDEQQGLDEGDVKGKSKDDELYAPSDEDEFTDEEKSKHQKRRGPKRGARPKGSGITVVRATGGRGQKGRNSGRKKQVPQRPVREPDLPKVASMGALKRSAPPTAVIRDEMSMEAGIKAALYRASPERGAIDYEFRSWKGTVSSSVCSLTSIDPSDRMLSTNFLGE
jgi:hypothetical protein